MIFLLLFCITASAESQVHIRTSVPETHSITVVSDGACVYMDGKSAKVFTVNRLSQPRILICPDADRVIKKVLLNDTDITDTVIGGYYTTMPICCDMTLRVETVAAPETTWRIVC